MGDAGEGGGGGGGSSCAHCLFIRLLVFLSLYVCAFVCPTVYLSGLLSGCRCLSVFLLALSTSSSRACTHDTVATLFLVIDSFDYSLSGQFS